LLTSTQINHFQRLKGLFKILGDSYLEVIQIKKNQIGFEKRFPQHDILVKRLVDIEGTTDEIVLFVLFAFFDNGVGLYNMFFFVIRKFQL